MADAVGGAAASGVPDDRADLRSAFENFNELVRTQGDVLAWVQRYFAPQAEYRPIEDRDWSRDPRAITDSLVRWIEVWGVGQFRITPDEILELGDDCLVVTARNRGVGRGSGVPIEAMTYIAMIWRGGRIVWFDEYLDSEAALAAAGGQTSAGGSPAPDARPTLAERMLKLSDAAFGGSYGAGATASSSACSAPIMPSARSSSARSRSSCRRRRAGSPARFSTSCSARRA
jgi:ketosteroid isomerase-like protein